ncbi:MAG: Hsp70 family protein, partial [Planctomycetota bacterium]
MSNQGNPTPVGPTPVGIDLGTSNCAVAYVTPAGRTAVLFNELGSVMTPSVIHFSEEGLVVGHEARKAFAYDAEAVASCVKRDVGLPQVRQAIEGKRFPPEFLHGCILQHLKAQIEAHLGGPYHAVITVPAFFDERRRKSVEDSARIAELPVIDVVNEPTAAALAYGELHGFLSEAAAPREKYTVLVYDLGGGTFDVTIIQLVAGKVTTLATDGDVQLGGCDWDARLADYAAQKFEAEHGIDPR